MALFTEPFCAFSDPPIASHKIPKTASSNSFTLSSVPSAQQYWSFVQDDTLTSTAFQHENYGPDNDTVSFVSPFLCSSWLLFIFGNLKFPIYKYACDLQGAFPVPHAEKLEICRNVLRKVVGDPFEILKVVDTLKRLCIDYYFQEEIETILRRQYVVYVAHGDCGHELHEAALRFRLLRQQGYYVPAGRLYFPNSS